MTETIDPGTIGVFLLFETDYFFGNWKFAQAQDFFPLIIPAYAQHQWWHKLFLRSLALSPSLSCCSTEWVKHVSPLENLSEISYLKIKMTRISAFLTSLPVLIETHLASSTA